MTILLISSDTVDMKMAGPGIRYWEFAQQLSQDHKVILLTPNVTALSHPRVRVLRHTRHTLRSALRQADVIVTQGYLYAIAPLILSHKPLVVDLYDPLPIELLEHHAHLSLNAAQLSQSYCVARTKLLLQRGDFFLYSHERQRDYWLGMLTAVGRVKHQRYRSDPNFSALFGCVPYGLNERPPAHTRTVLRGNAGLFAKQVVFTDTDTIVLWGGGLWKWFDPGAVIRAMADISAMRRDIKLVFLGGQSSATDATAVNIAYSRTEAITLSRQLGVENQTVFFNDDWVPFQERQNYLLEANLGISTHGESLETRLAFRTRLLDYLWAELPIITTTGDYLSDLVARHQLGITVAPGNVRQIRDAILRLTDDRQFAFQCRDNIRRIRPQFAWNEVIRPLAEFCAHPYQTCQLSSVAKWRRLLNFYVTTTHHIFTYQGYQKVLTKIRRKIFS